MQIRFAANIALLAGASLLAACSGDNGILGSSLTTSSVNSTPVAQTTPRQDPACALLASRIDQLRADGVTERFEKAAAGKGATVQVKRTSLAQMAELDKANAEFTTKCTPVGVRPQQAYAAPAATGSMTTGSTNVITAKAAAPIAPPIVQQPNQ